MESQSVVKFLFIIKKSLDLGSLVFVSDVKWSCMVLAFWVHTDAYYISSAELQIRVSKFGYLDICDPALLNEALWGECQNWEKYFIVINTIFYTFWCKNEYSVIYFYQKLRNVEHCHVRYYSKQLYRDLGCQRL